MFADVARFMHSRKTTRISPGNPSGTTSLQPRPALPSRWKRASAFAVLAKRNHTRPRCAERTAIDRRHRNLVHHELYHRCWSASELEASQNDGRNLCDQETETGLGMCRPMIVHVAGMMTTLLDQATATVRTISII